LATRISFLKRERGIPDIAFSNVFLEVLVQYIVNDLGSQLAGAAGFIIGGISFGDFV